MDMVFNYLPDVFSYQSMRHYNYENNWLQDATTNNRDNRFGKYGGAGGGAGTPGMKKSPRDSCKDPKDSCPICQERQRRPLATYIRSKSRQDRREDNSILEESEAEETPEAAAEEQAKNSPPK